MLPKRFLNSYRLEAPNYAVVPIACNLQLSDTRSIPAEALKVFDKFGIDFRKESELYTTHPPKGYGGWFHFCGSVESAEDDLLNIGPTYKIWFHAHVALVPKAFEGVKVGQLEFLVDDVGIDDSTASET
jgi:hypothetical protein